MATGIASPAVKYLSEASDSESVASDLMDLLLRKDISEQLGVAGHCNQWAWWLYSRGRSVVIMEPGDYLKQHHLLTYIEDLTGVLLEIRFSSSNKCFPTVHPIALIQEYFRKVLTGAHVYLREFSYVSSTPYNRACFIRMIWQCYYHGLTGSKASRGICMSFSEYHQLVQLLCHDFPAKFTDKGERLLLYKSFTSNETQVSFCDFMYTIQVLFYYENFIIECEKLFDRYNDGHGPIHPVKGVVVLPRLDGPDTPINAEPTIGPGITTPPVNDTDDLYDAVLYYHSVQNGSSPSKHSIEEILDSFKSSCCKNSFDDFLILLCNSECVNSDIGVLPPKCSFNDTVPPIIGSNYSPQI